jgi:hypothetical protein
MQMISFGYLLRHPYKQIQAMLAMVASELKIGNTVYLPEDFSTVTYEMLKNEFSILVHSSLKEGGSTKNYENFFDFNQEQFVDTATDTLIGVDGVCAWGLHFSRDYYNFAEIDIEELMKPLNKCAKKMKKEGRMNEDLKLVLFSHCCS